MKKLFILFALLTVLAALTLSACGGKDATTTETTTSSPAASTSSSTNPTSTTPDFMADAYNDPEKHVTLPEFHTITVSDKEINAEVDAYIQGVLGSLGRIDYVALDKSFAAIKGDSVNIHYTGRAKDASVTLSENTLAGMTNASDEVGYDLVLGSGSFIPGFEDQLIGAKEGDVVNVDVTFPEGYSAELGGVAVIFEVKVNKVSRASASDKHLLFGSILYTLKNDEANDKIAAFLAEHEVEIDLRDPESTFDDLFKVSLVSEALLGKTIYSTASFELTLPADKAAEYGYDHALTLTALFSVDQIILYPEELTDSEVELFTGGEYKDVASFRRYVYEHYRNAAAYSAVYDTATYAEIPKEVYDFLYSSYYDNWINNTLGDISDLTEEELAETLTDSVKKEAEEYAAANATAEYRDRMLMAYLGVRLNFSLTDDRYNEILTETYNYYLQNYYYQLIYSGISDIKSFEAYFGAENLRYQFTSDEIIALLGSQVSIGE